MSMSMHAYLSLYLLVNMCVGVCVCVCICIWPRDSHQINVLQLDEGSREGFAPYG